MAHVPSRRMRHHAGAPSSGILQRGCHSFMSNANVVPEAVGSTRKARPQSGQVICSITAFMELEAVTRLLLCRTSLANPRVPAISSVER